MSKKKNRIREFITDPSSGEFSMSRLCMGIVVIFWMPIYFILSAYKVSVNHQIITAALASLASVYALNSVGGAVGRYFSKREERTEIEIERKTGD